MGGIFSYFPTWSLIPEEIEKIDNVEATFLTPDSKSWDSYDDTYEDEEDNFIDHKGEMIYPQQKKRNLLMTEMFVRSPFQLNGMMKQFTKTWMTTR